MSGAATRGAPAGQPAMFNNALFNAAPEAQAMPQYAQQPSAEGSQPDVIGTRKGKPVYGPPKAFNPTAAVPDWARQAAPQPNPYMGSLFQSAPMASMPIQNVMQPTSPPALTLQQKIAQFQQKGSK